MCAECGYEFEPERADLPPDMHLPKGHKLRRGNGCRACRNTGYRGRVGVYELLRVTEEIREIVMQRGNAQKIAAAAMGSGSLVTLRQDGFTKALAGVTSVEEVVQALTT